MKNKKKNYNDFCCEIERLLKFNPGSNNVLELFSVSNKESDQRKSELKDHITKMKTSLPAWNKFENALKLYKFMIQYKKNYNTSARKKFISDMDERNSGQIIKKILRIHHFFSYMFHRSRYDAHKNCSFSIQDFYILSNEDWRKLANNYGFFKEYSEDINFWQGNNYNYNYDNNYNYVFKKIEGN